MSEEQTVPFVETGVQIPENVIVHCPMHQFKWKRAYNCEQCQHYQGILVINVNKEKEWSDRYRVLCAHPIARRTEKIMEIVE